MRKKACLTFGAQPKCSRQVEFKAVNEQMLGRDSGRVGADEAKIQLIIELRMVRKQSTVS